MVAQTGDEMAPQAANLDQTIGFLALFVVSGRWQGSVDRGGYI